jgi:amidase
VDPYISALELAALIKAKELSPLEAVDFYLARTDRLNEKLNAVTWRRDDDVRAEAKAAGEQIARTKDPSELGPFFGVPMPIKDLAFVEGWPMSFGSKALLDNITFFDATFIKNFREAGFLFLSRTNTPEFGVVCVTENDAWGATSNPWDTSRTPGGSSGGSASAVAAGLGPIAHASDGGGSIRIPASCCGLVGLKPSRGRVSDGPMVSDVMTGGAVNGCVSRTVADTAAVLDQICAHDPTAWYNAPDSERSFLSEVGAAPGKLRIAYETTAPTGASVDPACVEAVERTAAVLADLGHEVVEGGPPWPSVDEVSEQITGMFLTVWNTSMAYWGVTDWSKVEPLSAAMRKAAEETSSIQYVEAVVGLQIFTRHIVQAWGRDFDVYMTPTIAIEPPKIGALYEDIADPTDPLTRSADMAAFTPLFNATGQPAISLPLHWSEAGLPVGVQFIGKPWGEAELIRLSAQLEQAMPWRDRRPPID